MIGWSELETLLLDRLPQGTVVSATLYGTDQQGLGQSDVEICMQWPAPGVLVVLYREARQ
jgi:hypothetical protein